MKLHEHQAKEILKRSGVTVSDGGVAFTVDEAEKIAKQLGGRVVVKAQIHAGGRGKAGGVKLAKDASEARTHAQNILGKVLVTPQTGPEGKEVKRLWIEKASDIEKELYLAMLLDRATSRIMVMASREGGMEIEEVAAKWPEKIIKVWIDPVAGLQPYQARQLAFGLKLQEIDEKLPNQFTKFVLALYACYLKNDCSMLEVNPLIITKEKQVLALDCKMQLDDNALYRHPDLQEMRDPTEESASELKASKVGLNYIEMDGTIGCMVNGAGLAMATMDIIKLYGGTPANFLDVGGGATKEQVAEAFRLIVADKKVKAILVNIFGGIMKCDVIAEGIVAAAKELQLRVPLTVRLRGTNVDQGKKILADSKLNITSADDLDEAAKKAVASIK